MSTSTLSIGTRVVLTQDNRNPVTGYIHMAAGTFGTVTREANSVDEDPNSEIVVRWDGYAQRPVRTMRHAVAVAPQAAPTCPACNLQDGHPQCLCESLQPSTLLA